MQSARARAVTLRTYCRPLDEQGTKFETWEQVAHRATYDHHLRLWTEAGGEPNLEELRELEQLTVNRESMVAGRTLWLGGTKYGFERSSCMFNCAATNLESVYDIVDATWLLLNGCGVGARPQMGILHGYTTTIPELKIILGSNDKDFRGPEQNEETLPDASNDYVWTIKVGDSAKAWAKAPGKMLNTRARHARKLILDFSNIRGPGGRLNGYGWICNGSKPLAHAMAQVHQILNEKAGELLDEIDIGDIHNLMGTVLSSRRAAEILHMDAHNPRIKEYIACKHEYWKRGKDHRRQSNNSINYWSKPSCKEFEGILEHAYHNGDPAPINASAAIRKMPWWKFFNPCLRGDTLIVTRRGAHPIQNLVGRQEEVWDGSEWRLIDNFRVTGENQPLLLITLYDGAQLRVTPGHTMILEDGRRVEASYLSVGQRLLLHDVEYDGPLTTTAAYLKGFCLGDGTTSNGNSKLWVYETKYMCRERLARSLEEVPAGPIRTNALVEVAFRQDGSNRQNLQGLGCRSHELLPWCDEYRRGLPEEVFAWDRQTKCNFLAGLFDADGSALDNKNGYAYQLVSVQVQQLRDVQTILKSIGVRSHLGLMNKARRCNMPGGEYDCQACYRLTIAQRPAIRLAEQVKFERLANFSERTTTYHVKSRAGRVMAIEPAGIADKVYCCTVPGTHRMSLSIGVQTGQCAEIGLGSFCNLVTSVLPNFGRNYAKLERAVYTIARANYRQTCVNLDDGILQPKWHQSNQALRLCGTSMTGIEQASWISDYQIRRLRNAAIAGSYSMADELKLPRPKAVTCVKPEGTTSKISDCSEGIHRPLGRFIFNWIAFSIHDPLIDAHVAAGYSVIPHPQDANNCLICFPVEYDNVAFDVVDGKEVNLETAVSQLERYLRWNTLWADHNVSATISMSHEEIPTVAAWLDDNWDRGYIAAAFLQRNDPTKTAADLGHPYLPQEVVTQEKFLEYTQRLKTPNLDNLQGIFEIDAGECAGGACPAK